MNGGTNHTKFAAAPADRWCSACQQDVTSRCNGDTHECPFNWPSIGATPKIAPMPIKGVRVEGDKVVISVVGGNEAARRVCSDLLFIKEHMVTMAPINMVLHCPNCGEQHIDAPSPDIPGSVMRDGKWVDVPCVIKANDPNAWTNPPHRSHLCDACGHIWRPADVATNGVAEINTKGKKDSSHPEFNTENEAQGYAIEAIWQFCPELKPREDGRVLLTPAQVETALRRMGWRPPGEAREPTGVRP